MCSPTRKRSFSDFLSSTTMSVDGFSSSATANKMFFALTIRIPHCDKECSDESFLQRDGKKREEEKQKEKEAIHQLFIEEMPNSQ